MDSYYKHYGVLQYRSNPTGKWRNFRDAQNQPVIICYNTDPFAHLSAFMREYIRVYEEPQENG